MSHLSLVLMRPGRATTDGSGNNLCLLLDKGCQVIAGNYKKLIIPCVKNIEMPGHWHHDLQQLQNNIGSHH